MTRTELDRLSGHGLSEPIESKHDAITDIIKTLTYLFTSLGEIDLRTQDIDIADICVDCGVECLHAIIIAKELRTGL